MSSYYSGEHNLTPYTHKDIRTCNTEKPQQKYRTGTVSNRLLDPKPRRLFLQWFKTFGQHEHRKQTHNE